MWYLILLFILGTIIGSFLNLCIERLPRGESIIFPFSHCPSCKHRLGPVDLIPVVGFFLLRGKCRYCGAAISWRYPLVELISGGFFVLSGLTCPLFYNPLNFFFYLIFISLLIVIFFIDLERKVIPDVLNILGVIAGLAFNFGRGLNWTRPGVLNPFLSALIGMALGYLLLYLIGAVGKFLFRKEALGEGDLYLGAFLGAYLGWQWLLLALFLAYLLGGGVALMLLLLRRISLGSYMPFGPALVAGGLIALFFGDWLVFWYLSLF